MARCLLLTMEMQCLEVSRDFQGARLEQLLEDGLCHIIVVMADDQLVLHAYGLGRTI